MKQGIFDKKQQLTDNVSTLSQGIYIVKTETDNGIVTRKFVTE